MGLKVKKEVQGSTTTFFIKGSLDISTASLLDPYLDELVNVDVLIFDLSDLEFIDSSGIGTIMNAIYLSQEKNYKFKLRGIKELTHEVFEMIGLYEVLDAIEQGVAE